MKKCPYCAEEIQDEAVICRYCHMDLKAGKFAQTVPKEVRAKSSIRDGVRLGFGMFIVLPLLIIGIVLILAALGGAFAGSFAKAVIVIVFLVICGLITYTAIKETKKDEKKI